MRPPSTTRAERDREGAVGERRALVRDETDALAVVDRVLRVDVVVVEAVRLDDRTRAERRDVDGHRDRLVLAAVHEEHGRGAGLGVVGRDRVDERRVAVDLRVVAADVDARARAPRPARAGEVTENGKNVVCRQAAPPGSVMIGAITLTSCARRREPTRSLCFSSVISRLPSTTASATE